MKTELYRHFDANDQLLYVGISFSTFGRLAAHKNCAVWFDDIVKITIERFASRQLAIAAERAAIENERPKFNRSFSVLDTRFDKPKVLIGIKDVCYKLSIDPKTLRKRLVNGSFPVAPIPGTKPPKWRAVEIDAYVTGSKDA